MEPRLVSERKNPLLGRREVTLMFPMAAGFLKRTEAVQAAAKALNIEQSKVSLIALDGGFGSRDLEGRFYVYEDEKAAKAQLTQHFFLRLLPKEERKKASEEKRKAKVAAKSPAASKAPVKPQAKAQTKV